MSHITELFLKGGGLFNTSEAEIIEKLRKIKAFVFDWDGVFTNAGKDHNLDSKFSEADSMGTNLLRFSYYLNHGEAPLTAIISGEKNTAAFTFADRERFHYSYSKFANKMVAVRHLCGLNNLQLHQICFVFDDVLDLGLAEVCGLRIFIPRKSNPLLNEYVNRHQLADYVTGASSGEHAVREATELLMGLNGNYNEVVTERKNFSPAYASYLDLKKSVDTFYYTTLEGEIVESKQQ